MKQHSHISLGPENESLLTTIPTSTRSDKTPQTENLKVAVRVRPQLPAEYHKPISVFYDETRPEVIKVANSTSSAMNQSHYDKIFREDSQQAEVFSFLEDSVLNTLNGFNCTIFAYGQTGSGKTYTMFGPNWEEAVRAQMFSKNAGAGAGVAASTLFGDQASHGVIPRAIERLFVELRRMGANYTVYCSFLQVYNERLYDLLQDYETKRPLQIREDKQNGIYVQELSEYVITNARDCFTLLKRGECNRITRATRANIASSRSHTIFQLLIETDTVDHRGYFKHGKLNLCDLAGSEKLSKEETGSGQRVSEKHLTELKTINLSLSTLGKVISALGKKSHQGPTSSVHIPYRDSKLTRFLQDSLGGHTRTVLIATVSPNIDCADESLSTLKFADRAKSVMVRVKANEVSAHDDALVNKLQREVQHLREILNLRRKGDPHDMTQEILMLKQENSRLKELASRVQEVESLKQENKRMRIELQRLQLEASESGGAGNTQNEFFITGGYSQLDEAYKQQQQAYGSESNHMVSPQAVISEAEELQTSNSEELRAAILPSVPVKLVKQQADPRTFSNLDKQTMKPVGRYMSEPHQRSPPDMMPPIQMNSTRGESSSSSKKRYQSPRTTGGLAQKIMRTPEMLNLSKMSADEIAEVLEVQRLKEFEQAANHLKQNLSKSGRCPVCTLPPPCKHYKSSQDIPQVNKVRSQDIKIQETRHFALNRRSHDVELPLPPPPILSKNGKSRGDAEPVRAFHSVGMKGGEGSPVSSIRQSQRDISPQLPPLRAPLPPMKKAHSVTRGSNNDSMYSGGGGGLNRSSIVQGGYSVASEGRRGKSEEVVVRIRGKHGVFKTQRTDVNQTLKEASETETRRKEIKKANERLRVLERLERYREEKMIRQFQQFEQEQRKEEEERAELAKKEQARRKYLEKQKRNLEAHNRVKAEKEAHAREREAQEKQMSKEKEKRKKVQQLEQKIKINEYKIKKKIIDDFLKSNQIYSIDDLRDRGQIYLPQGLHRNTDPSMRDLEMVAEQVSAQDRDSLDILEAAAAPQQQGLAKVPQPETAPLAQ